MKGAPEGPRIGLPEKKKKENQPATNTTNYNLRPSLYMQLFDDDLGFVSAGPTIVVERKFGLLANRASASRGPIVA